MFSCGTLNSVKDQFTLVDLRSPGILRSVYWQFITDFSGQTIGLIPLKMGLIICPEKSATNYHLRCINSQSSEDLIYTAAEA
jgi:hypothetical protein